MLRRLQDFLPILWKHHTMDQTIPSRCPKGFGSTLSESHPLLWPRWRNTSLVQKNQENSGILANPLKMLKLRIIKRIYKVSIRIFIIVYLVHLIYKMSCDFLRKKQTPPVQVEARVRMGHHQAIHIILPTPLVWALDPAGHQVVALVVFHDLLPPSHRRLLQHRNEEISLNQCCCHHSTMQLCFCFHLHLFWIQGTWNLHPTALGQGSRSVDPLQRLQFHERATRRHRCVPRLCDLPRRRKSTLPAAPNRPSSRTGGVGHTWT